MKALILFVLTTAASFGGILEDQFLAIKNKRAAAIAELNRLAVPHLTAILRKAEADKNTSLEAAIRLELYQLGYPDPSDWYAGVWVVADTDRCTRYYELLPNGTARILGWNYGTDPMAKDESLGSLEVIGGKAIAKFPNAIVSFDRQVSGDVVTPRWFVTTLYPDITKTVPGVGKLKK